MPEPADQPTPSLQPAESLQPVQSLQPRQTAPVQASSRLVLQPTIGPISLTQFYPFVLADPLTKRAELRAIKASHGVYTPALDYWRLLRLQIISHHRYTPGRGLDALDTAIELAHASREANYRLAVSNYRRFVGRRWVEWLGRPMRSLWEAGDLAVRVNPELWISIDGEPFVVKLYLRSDPRWALDQRLANPMVYLLQRFHGRLGRPLVFDVLRGRAFGLTRADVDYESLLQAQAAAFVSLWRSEHTPTPDEEAPLAA